MSKLKGFTLVEIMISVVILGVGLSLVANSYILSLKGINIVANNIEALNLAKEKLDELEILSLKDGLSVSSTRSDLKSGTKNYNYTQEITEITQPEDFAKNLVLACLTVNWQEQNSTKNVNLSAYLLKKKE